MIDANLYTFLNAQTVVTDIVSSRIYPEILESDPTYPAITYRIESHDFDRTFEGNGGFVRSDYMLDAWSQTHSGAITLSNAIRTALMNHSGSFGGINVNKILVSSGPVTVFEDSVEAYRITQIFSIWHKEG